MLAVLQIVRHLRHTGNLAQRTFDRRDRFEHFARPVAVEIELDIGLDDTRFLFDDGEVFQTVALDERREVPSHPLGQLEGMGGTDTVGIVEIERKVQHGIDVAVDEALRRHVVQLHRDIKDMLAAFVLAGGIDPRAGDGGDGFEAIGFFMFE